MSETRVSDDTFQQRVKPWMTACFGDEISADKIERNHRFIEEALELVQANGCTQSEVHQLVDYVYGRDQGDINQEVGGVMVTLAALCLASGFDMHAAGETELARVWTKIEKIRAKQAAKPKHSPLPELRDLRASRGGEPVAVKALEWSVWYSDDAKKEYTLTAKSALGSYNVYSQWRLPGMTMSPAWKGPTEKEVSAPTVDEAKAAAQADYEQRIRAALVPSPPPSAAPPSEGVATTDISGEMWMAGRSEFVKFAERYHNATRYEETAMIADIAPAEIWRAMRLAELLLAIDSLRTPPSPGPGTTFADGVEAAAHLAERFDSGVEDYTGETPAYVLKKEIADAIRKLAPPVPQVSGEGRDERQKRVAEWCAAAFGAEHQASVPQRGLRMLEEAIEAYQALAGDPAQAHKLIDYIYAKEPGKLHQELGGLGLTVLALAAAAGLSADEAERTEIARVLAKPLAWFHERNKVKNDAGFNALAYPVPAPPVPGAST